MIGGMHHHGDNDEDYAQEPYDVIRARWLMDGATSLLDAAARLESFCQVLRHLHATGWRLQGPIEDDYGIIVPSEAGPS